MMEVGEKISGKRRVSSEEMPVIGGHRGTLHKHLSSVLTEGHYTKHLSSVLTEGALHERIRMGGK